MYISLDTDKDCDPLHDIPLFDWEDAAWQTELLLSWLQPADQPTNRLTEQQL